VATVGVARRNGDAGNDLLMPCYSGEYVARQKTTVDGSIGVVFLWLSGFSQMNPFE
jgi:hypothetical protein